jgi:hypothetical protein
MHLNFFYVYQTPVPKSLNDEIPKQIIEISARLSSMDIRFREFASALNVQYGPMNMHKRIQLTAKLNALVAKHFGLNKEQLEVILQSFEGFEEDKELVNIKELRWDDVLIRRFNGEVRKHVLPYFDQLHSQEVGAKSV